MTCQQNIATFLFSLTTALGFACVSKVPVGFRNLQSRSAVKLIL